MYFTRAIMKPGSFKIVLVLAGLLLFLVEGKAQRTLFEQDVDTSGAIPKFGPNRAFYVHPYVAYGLMFWPQEDGARTKWYSSNYAYALRFKRKLAWWDSWIVDIGYRYDYFSLNQKKTKMAPLDTIRHSREFLSVHNVSGEFCNRINFSRRGDVLGTWLDIGVYADWVFRTSDRYVDRYEDPNSPAGRYYRDKRRIVGLPYIQTRNYGFVLRCGGENTALFVRYRLNELIKDRADADDPDLPKLTIGIEIFPGYY